MCSSEMGKRNDEQISSLAAADLIDSVLRL